MTTADDENKTANGFIEVFGNVNGTLKLHDDKILLDVKKFIIGLWLGITSLTFALIFHVGRCSVKTANAVNKVLWDVTDAVNKIIHIPQSFLKLVKSATSKLEEKDDSKEKAAHGVVDMLADEQKQPAEEESKKDKDIVTAANPEEVQETGSEPQHTTAAASGMELVTLGQDTSSGNQQHQELELETDFTDSVNKTTFKGIKHKTHGHYQTIEVEDIDHAFAYFAKGIRKFSTTSIILLVAFIVYDVYIYFRLARKGSYDWFMLFPFPFWFSLVLLTNICAIIITEIVLCFRRKKMQKDNTYDSKHSIFFILFVNFFTTLSVTTLPVFVFFHSFWIALASSAFTIRIASSALFYIPLVTFVFWFLAISSWILRVWKKLIKKEIKKKPDLSFKRVLRLIPHFIRPLIPYFFLPFWLLFLATLHMFSDFLNDVVNIRDHSLIVIVGITVGIIGVTKKIADDCKPHLHDDELEDN